MTEDGKIVCCDANTSMNIVYEIFSSCLKKSDGYNGFLTCLPQGFPTFSAARERSDREYFFALKWPVELETWKRRNYYYVILICASFSYTRHAYYVSHDWDCSGQEVH
jgi:hypothetical protein